MRLSALALAASLALSGVAAAAGKLERRLYVTDRSTISVYDIDNGHALVRRIEVPDGGGYKGIAASVQLGKLYVSSYKQDELICIDLATDKIDWRKKLGKYADSMWVTPDGQTMYIPYRDDDSWWVLRAKDAEVIAKIPVGRGRNYDVDPIGSIGPHNTWINPAGTRVYLEVLTLPYVYIADTKTNKLIGKVGPFSKGVRPFAVSDDEKYVYANVDGLLGFEVGAVRDGKNGAAPCFTAWRQKHRLPASPNIQIRRRVSRTARPVMGSISARIRKKSGWSMASTATSTYTT